MPALQIAEETVPAEEAKYTQILLDRMKQKIVDDASVGRMRRDVHLKMHGAVKAEFIVEPNLPPDLRVGIFKEPKTYQAWIRFSNADGSVKPDGSRDIRGMAIKVLGVPGEKILATEKHAQTQDFLLVSAPILPTKDVEMFARLVLVVLGSTFAKIRFFLTHWRVAWILFRTMRKFSNPLQIRYFSTTPYRFGEDSAVKYSAIPLFRKADPLPNPATDDFLRNATAAQLLAGEALFDFSVQFQTNPITMPIEDPRREWSQSASPFRKLATIRILQQDCDNYQQVMFGENLSFTPWHALPEHEPLGGINRARKVIYETISMARHEYNQEPRIEPESW